MIFCAVSGCPNNIETAESGINFFCFPKSPFVAQQWISACCQDDNIDMETAYICSLHFDSNSYTHNVLDVSGIQTPILKHDAIPTLHLPFSEVLISEEKQILQTTDDSSIMVYELFSGEENTLKFEPAEHKIMESDLKDTLNIYDTTDNHLNIKRERNNSLSIKLDLVPLQKENDLLQKEVNELQIEIEKLSSKLKHKELIKKKKNIILRKSIDEFYKLRRETLNSFEQKKILSRVFSDAQIKILSGKQKIWWSDDDMAVGFTVNHLSNKRCYNYISKRLRIPLPALSSIKRVFHEKQKSKKDLMKNNCS